MKRSWLVIAFLFGLAWAPLPGAPPEGGAASGTFMRVEEDATGLRLQTGIGSYRGPNGVTVDLIGAIHIADRAYYEKLNRRFDRYEAVLYEMVGESNEKRWEWKKAGERLDATLGEKAGRESAGPGRSGEERLKALEEYFAETRSGENSVRTAAEVRQEAREAAEEEAAARNLAWLHPMFDLIQSALGLTAQLDGIRYRRKNFVHADMTLRQFAALQQENHESFLSLWWKSVVVQLTRPEASIEQPGLLKIMESLCRQDGTLGLRRIAARTFGSVEGLIAGLESENGTVILTERNKVALKVLEEQMKLGKRNFAIFFGAAHLPDMERRLLAMGFARSGGEWFNAWDMPPEPEARR